MLRAAKRRCFVAFHYVGQCQFPTLTKLFCTSLLLKFNQTLHLSSHRCLVFPSWKRFLLRAPTVPKKEPPGGGGEAGEVWTALIWLWVGGADDREEGGCLAPAPGLCDCVVFGEPLSAHVLSSISRLWERWGRPSSSFTTRSDPLIKSTLSRAKRDNRGKVGRLRSLSQEEEVP